MTATPVETVSGMRLWKTNQLTDVISNNKQFENVLFVCFIFYIFQQARANLGYLGRICLPSS